MGRLLIRILPFVFAACGSQGIDPNDLNAGADGGSTSTDPPPTPYTDPFAGTPAYASHTNGGDQPHNAGQACSGDKSCHGGEGPPFLIGGTVYKDYAGTQPAGGVEIRVLDTQGNAVSTYSYGNGTFYIRSGQSNVALPAVVGARDGTITRPMITQLTGSMGSCGNAGCHVGTNAGGYYPIHVP